MIVFEFGTDLSKEGRVCYWLGTTECTGLDKQHEDEIYEQLDAQTAGLTECLIQNRE